MIAAGHIEIDNIEKPLLNNFVAHDYRQKRNWFSKISPYEKRQELEAVERKFFQVILAHLYKVNYPWNIKKPEARPYKQNLIIDIDYKGYKKWIFEFRASLYNRTFMPLFHNIYSQLVMRDIKPTEKITIVVNTEKNFELFFKRPPKSLRANLYVMLIDLDKGEIIKEEKLCSYDPK